MTTDAKFNGDWKTESLELRDELMELKRQLDEYAAELAKYRDAPVVAYWYKYHNCFGDEVWATDSNWGGRTPLESNPLIVKPGEEK